MYQVTNREGMLVCYGDVVTDFRGETAIFDCVVRGEDYNGTAKVRVMSGTLTAPQFGYYYANVYGLTVRTIDED